MNKLAGDIGGTHSRLSLSPDSLKKNTFIEKTYLSANYSSLLELINVFLSEHNVVTEITGICLAVAGPVNSGTVKITNLSWEISEEMLSKAFKTPHVKLINDFTAAAYGVTAISEDDFEVIYHGNKINTEKPNNDAVIMGAGTGLGVAHIISLNHHFYVYPSEAGHVGFAPANVLQSELLIWLQHSHSHVSLEMLLSGSGLFLIYKFLRDIKKIPEAKNIAEQIKETDPAKVISDEGLLEKDKLCKRSLDIFVDIYAAAAGNVVLNYYPINTLYIAGGIAPKIKQRLKSENFIKQFCNKGLMSYIVKKVVIKLVLNEKIGLIGARNHLLKEQ